MSKMTAGGAPLRPFYTGPRMVGAAITVKSRPGDHLMVHNRDSEELFAGAFPVFAAGVTNRGTYKDGPGEVHVPIAIKGMVISPRDLVCVDADGFLCVPLEAVEHVYLAASQKHDAENKHLANIESGKMTGPGWMHRSMVSDARSNSYSEL